MILRIVPEIESCEDLNVKLIDYNTFNFPEVHFFIATGNWDVIEVHLKQKGLIKGYLSQVISRSSIIKVKLLEDVDENMLFLLRELYPEQAPYLRRAFFNSPSDVVSLLREQGVLIDE